MGTVSEHINQYQLDDPRFVEQIKRALYMDDIISGCDSVKEEFEVFVKLKNRVAGAKLCYIHKFLSSSPELMKIIRVLEKINSSEIAVDDKPVVSEDLSYAKLTVNVSETENQGNW